MQHLVVELVLQLVEGNKVFYVVLRRRIAAVRRNGNLMTQVDGPLKTAGTHSAGRYAAIAARIVCGVISFISAPLLAEIGERKAGKRLLRGKGILYE